MKEVFISIVTAPAVLAAGIDEDGKGEDDRDRPDEGDAVNVFTVFTSVFMG
jgi:hypothetical protein